jgi:hypothetical protein
MSEGLTQRRRAAVEAAKQNDEMKTFEDGGGGGDSDGSGTGDMADDDKKSTRLTLMEEVLLLGLKDREVQIRFFLIEGLLPVSGVHVILVSCLQLTHKSCPPSRAQIIAIIDPSPQHSLFPSPP